MSKYTYKQDGAVYEGDVIMGEFDDDTGKFVPSKALLERPPAEHKAVEAFANGLNILAAVQALADNSPLEHGQIVVTDENGVSEIRAVTNANWEQLFTNVCAAHISNWDEHTDEEREDIVSEGLYSTKGGKIIAVIWLDAEGNYNC